MKSRRYPGDPFIPRWLDELGLAANEFRVLCHLWRRGRGTCFPSGETIAQTCRLHPDTVWKVLKKLETQSLIRRRPKTGSRGRHNEYELLVPTDFKCEENHPSDSAVSNLHPDRVFDSPKSRGRKVHQERVPHQEGFQVFGAAGEEPPRDSNSEPVGSALSHNDGQVALPSREGAVAIAAELYQKHRFDPDSPIGVLSESEIRQFAVKWLLDAMATGGLLNGSPIRVPRIALESYLFSCAQKQSKRCHEFDHGVARSSGFVVATD